MGHQCCSKQKVKRGLWSPEEDEKLIRHITTHGHGSWSSVPKLAGLQRCGKSCRLRWINYLRPDLKRGSFTAEEEQIIIDVHRILGNRWAQIAKHLPGRTDNEVKNFWNSCIKKKLISQGLDPKTHNLIPSHKRASDNATSNIPRIHHHHHQQQPAFSVFTVSSHTTDAPGQIINPPVLTLPAPPPPLNDHQSIINCGYQDRNGFLWTALNANNDQNSQVSNIFPYVSSIESTTISCSSSSFVNPSAFGLLDQSHLICGSNAIAEPFEAPRMEGVQSYEQAKRQEENMCLMATEQMEEFRSGQDMDASLDSPTFDFEFVETLMPAAAMCRDMASMDDFAWTF